MAQKLTEHEKNANQPPNPNKIMGELKNPKAVRTLETTHPREIFRAPRIFRTIAKRLKERARTASTSCIRRSAAGIPHAKSAP